MNNAAGQPLVSVVVRSMARPSLPAALGALGAQDYPNLEIVVVAACGPEHPDVPAVAGPHPVRLVRSATPLARARAANAGLDEARGEWISFLDDDDLCDADHISGLVHEAIRVAAAPAHAEVVYSFARAVLANGTQSRLGHPFSLMQLYERNFIHLASAVVARTALTAGCRFDETFDVHEGWDFFLQLAQRHAPHFIPRQSFIWHPEAGTSGTGAGANQDDARFATFRDLLYAKWSPQRDALIDRVEPLLRDAATRTQGGDLNGARTVLGQVLSLSPNDPHALNLLAMLERASNNLPSSLAIQELAAVVRPQDPDFAYNLALIYRDTGNVAAARTQVTRALSLDSGNARARALATELDVAPPLLA